MPIGAALIVIDGGLTTGTLFSGLLALGGGAVAGAVLTRIACRLLRIQVHTDGMTLQNEWGFQHNVTWDAIREIRPFNLGGLKYVRIYSTTTSRTLWLPLFLNDRQQFVSLVTQYAESTNPLVCFLSEKADQRSLMIHNRRRRFIIVPLLAAVTCFLGWYAYAEYPKTQFLRDLCLVGFSTFMISHPKEEQENTAHDRAEELGIDLFAAYKSNLKPGLRYQLAWMLITKQSTEYTQFASQNIDYVPWPEVRIWISRRNQESLSPDYRQKLLDLILASPTSEAKLSAARWCHKQGKIAESEDAYHAAMTNGLFWDALDAADQLLESERYHNDAVNHLLSLVRDSEDFFVRAAYSLLDLYDVREEMNPLVDRCIKEPREGPNRKLLVDKLTKLVEKDVGDSKP